MPDVPELSFRLEKHTITRPTQPAVRTERWTLTEQTGLCYEPTPQLVELWAAYQTALSRIAELERLAQADRDCLAALQAQLRKAHAPKGRPGQAKPPTAPSSTSSTSST